MLTSSPQQIQAAQEQLRKAVDANNPGDILKALQAGAPLTAFYSHGFPHIIHWAAALGHAEIISEVFARDPASINLPNSHHFDWTPLHYAAAVGNTNATRVLLNCGANIQAKDDQKKNVGYGSQSGYDFIEWALKDLPIEPQHGWTPLHYAAQNGHTSVVHALLLAGADPLQTTSNGKNATQIAHSAFKQTTTKTEQLRLREVIELLKNPTKKPGYFPQTIANKQLKKAMLKNDPTAAITALRAGAQLNVRVRGNNPLHWAIINGYTDVANLIIDQNPAAALEAQTLKSLRSIRYSEYRAEQRNSSEYKYLFVWGESPLHLAIRRDRTGIALKLIEKGVDLDREDTYDISPLAEAAIHNNEIVVNALISSFQNKQEGVNGTNHQVCDSPLYYAAQNGNTAIVRALILAGADVESRHDGSINYRCIHVAAMENHADCVNALLDGNADINSTDENFTALHWAVIEEANDAFDVLIRRGANVNIATDYEDFTPLHFAAYYRDEAMVNALLNAGADKSARDSKGRTAFDLARSGDLTEWAFTLSERNDPLSPEMLSRLAPNAPAQSFSQNRSGVSPLRNGMSAGDLTQLFAQFSLGHRSVVTHSAAIGSPVPVNPPITHYYRGQTTGLTRMSGVYPGRADSMSAEENARSVLVNYTEPTNPHNTIYTRKVKI